MKAFIYYNPIAKFYYIINEEYKCLRTQNRMIFDTIKECLLFLESKIYKSMNYNPRYYGQFILKIDLEKPIREQFPEYLI